MALEAYLRERLVRKPLLVMTHVVCGYPSFEDNLRALEVMAEFDVDLVELQFPFSEPSADGPRFVHANQVAIERGTHTRDCFAFMARAARRFPFRLLMMGYYNTVFKMGEAAFVERLAAAGGSGMIVPDLPLEEAGTLRRLAAERDLDPILLMAPTNTDARLAQLGEAARGFVYAVARKGVTGSKTAMDEDLVAFIGRCRRATRVPVGVGFGIGSRSDIEFLRGRADIAIIGTAALAAWEDGGESGLRAFLSELLSTPQGQGA
jgi:tryptophan synthase alpha chain